MFEKIKERIQRDRDITKVLTDSTIGLPMKDFLRYGNECLPESCDDREKLIKALEIAICTLERKHLNETIKAIKDALK